MADIEWKIDGRKIPQSGVGAALAKSLEKGFEEEIKKTLSRVRCPEHGNTPKNIRLIGSISRGGQIKIDCCCDKLEAAIAKALQ